MAFIPHQCCTQRHLKSVKNLVHHGFAHNSKLKKALLRNIFAPSYNALFSSTLAGGNWQHEKIQQPVEVENFQMLRENLSPSFQFSEEHLPSDLKVKNGEQSHSLPRLNLQFMPNFYFAAKFSYTKTRKRALIKKIASYYGRDTRLFETVLKMHPELLYCPISDVEQCLSLFTDLGFRKEELLRGSSLLLQNPSFLLALKELFEDLGLLCNPRIGIIRLHNLMEVPEQELVERGLLPAQPSVMEQLLCKIGEQHVVDKEKLLSEAHRKFPLKFTYYEALAGFLAQRFDVSFADARQLLHSYQPTYKPLRHYYVICDLITRKLNVDFQRVRKKPELLDIFPVAALSLMNRHPVMFSVDTAQLLSEHPSLTSGSSDLLTRWLELLSHNGVEELRLSPVVQWVLGQDLLEIAHLVLMFLPSHPLWSEIRKSTFLFEIFANPSVMDKLMSSDKSKSAQKSRIGKHSQPAAEARQNNTISPDTSSSSSISSAKSTSSSISLDNKTSQTSLAHISSSSLPSTNTSTKEGEKHRDPWTNRRSNIQEKISDVSQLDLVSEENRLVRGDFDLLNELVVDASSPLLKEERPYYAPRYSNNIAKFGPFKVRPPYEVVPYLRQQLRVPSNEAAKIGWCLNHKCSLTSVVEIMAMLTEAGFTQQQMSAALPIFSADPDLLKEQLCRLEEEESYVRYWKCHPNGLNLLLYRVKSCVARDDEHQSEMLGETFGIESGDDVKIIDDEESMS